MEFQKKLAAALERVKEKSQGNIIFTDSITRADRELLLKNDWLELIIKGWYMLTTPGNRKGESSGWYMNFWKFISLYLHYYYNDRYCLSAENSIDLHIDSPAIPQQVIVIVEKGGGTHIQLPFGTSIFPYSDPKNLPFEVVTIKEIRLMELPYALCKVSPAFFEKEPKNAEIALRMIRSPEELIRPIVKYGFHRAAARLVGAYQFLGEEKFSKAIKEEIDRFGMKITPENPFQHPVPFTKKSIYSPYILRIHLMWSDFREKILNEFPNPSKISKNKKKYISQIEENYQQDAYHSLSIEGYEVGIDLIEKVRNHQWNPDVYENRNIVNALAARGYYEAFREVESTIVKIFDGAPPGETVAVDLAHWYQAIFAPSVKAGLLKPMDLLGYRKSPVYIRNSRHVPLPKESLLDAMEAFFVCLKEEKHPGVRAVLGHFIFVYIHPYMDGNGRIARFIMNTMFITGGYPWTIIQLNNRKEYFAALESASVQQNIIPFTKFLVKEMEGKSGFLS